MSRWTFECQERNKCPTRLVINVDVDRFSDGARDFGLGVGTQKGSGIVKKHESVDLGLDGDVNDLVKVILMRAFCQLGLGNIH